MTSSCPDLTPHARAHLSLGKLTPHLNHEFPHVNGTEEGLVQCSKLGGVAADAAAAISAETATLIVGDEDDLDESEVLC